jgi:hypothetical protein
MNAEKAVGCGRVTATRRGSLALLAQAVNTA